MTDSDDGRDQRQLPEPAGWASLKWLWVTGAVLSLDQLTKVLVVMYMQEYQRIAIWPFFDLVRRHNTGAAFSILSEASGWQHWLFIGLGVVVSGWIIWWQWRMPRQNHRVLSLGLALVLGGAIGNVIDRIMYGHVVDFLLFYYREWQYPAFNVADSAITIGVILIVYDGFFLERKRGGRRATDSPQSS